jgi:hypothetical protein
LTLNTANYDQNDEQKSINYIYNSTKQVILSRDVFSDAKSVDTNFIRLNPDLVLLEENNKLDLNSKSISINNNHNNLLFGEDSLRDCSCCVVYNNQQAKTENTNNNMNVHSNNRSKNNSRKVQRILPNINAVKRGNAPLRGLAFREAHQRIVLSHSDLINQRNEYNGVLVDVYELQQQQAQAQSINSAKLVSENVETNLLSNNISKISKHTTYREMLKGLKKGIAINMYQSFIENLNETLVSNKNKIMAHPTPKSGFSLKSKKSSVLNVKGDKIDTGNLESLTPATCIMSKSAQSSSTKKAPVNTAKTYLSKKPEKLELEKNNENSGVKMESGLNELSINLNEKIGSMLFGEDVEEQQLGIKSGQSTPRSQQSLHINHN